MVARPHLRQTSHDLSARQTVPQRARISTAEVLSLDLFA